MKITTAIICGSSLLITGLFIHSIELSPQNNRILSYLLILEKEEEKVMFGTTGLAKYKGETSFCFTQRRKGAKTQGRKD
jgi:hypothetical protein